MRWCDRLVRWFGGRECGRAEEVIVALEVDDADRQSRNSDEWYYPRRDGPQNTLASDGCMVSQLGLGLNLRL